MDGDVCSGEVFCVRFRDSRCEVGGCGGREDGFLGWVGEDFLVVGGCMRRGGVYDPRGLQGGRESVLVGSYAVELRCGRVAFDDV